MATARPWTLEQDAANMLNSSNLDETLQNKFISTHPLILIGTAVTILLIVTIAYRCYRVRQRCDCCDEEDDEERQTLLPHGSGFSCLRKTSTYYQWNQTPPSCQRSPISPEKSWEHRRSALLKKYAAVQDTD
ncbi:hypothetical protein K501DRAFT_333358 [Backusella circina FSU 941]|nr:hypothetical protein K501DRAFT_333358 [Backusella circina FSU 941]